MRAYRLVRPSGLLAVWLVLGLLAPQAAFGDEPTADYIFPAGGQQGTVVRARIGANFLHGKAEFRLQGPGVEADSVIHETETTFFEGPLIYKPASQRAEDYPRDHAANISIASDSPAGVRWWRLRTSQGVTASRPFVIGTLPEIIEDEVDGRPLPAPVKAPLTINGRIFPREDVDIWTFDAVAGQTYSCEVCAQAIQSPLDSQLQVFSPDGQLIAENDDAQSADSRLQFTARVSGPHQVRIYDCEFRGLQNYVYRLTIQNAPSVMSVYPLGGRQGEKTRFELQMPRNTTGPRTAVVDRLLNESTGTRQVRFNLDSGVSNLTAIEIGKDLEFVQWDQPLSSQAPVQAPCVLNGRIRESGQRDEWKLTAKAGESVSFQLKSHVLGSPLLARLTVLDDEGKELKVSEMDAARPNTIGLDFKAPKDAVYTVRVDSPLDDGRGAYRLHCRNGEPEFQLTLDSDAVNLYRGQKAKITVKITRSGNVGEVQLKILGLPEGVTASEAKIAEKKPNASIELSAAKDARVSGSLITIQGVAKIGEQEQIRVAAVPSPMNGQDRSEVLLGVCMPTPFTVDGVAFETRYGPRGTIFRRHFILHRNDFQGPLQIKLADRQIRHLQGVQGGVMELGPAQSEFDYAIRIPTWLEMNRTSRTVVMAVGSVLDEQGVPHTVSFTPKAPKDQIILLTAPCPMSISTSRRSFAVVENESLTIPFQIDRGVLKPAEVQVELLTPKHIQGISSKTMLLDADQNSGELVVTFERGAGPFNMPLTLRASTMQDGDPVVADAPIEFALAPQ